MDGKYCFQDVDIKMIQKWVVVRMFVRTGALAHCEVTALEIREASLKIQGVCNHRDLR